MNYLEFVRQLSAEQRKSLTRKSNIAGCRHLTGHLLAIAITGLLIYAGVVAWPLLMLVHGILLIFLFTLLHETIHRTAFASRNLNEIIASVCSLLLILPKEWFRYFHYAHHRHTQDPIKDPELATPKPETMWHYVLYISGLPLWKSLLITLFVNARGRCTDSFVPTSAQTKVCVEARLMIAVYLLLALISIVNESTLLLFIWIIPVLLGQPFLRLYLLAEHGRCAYIADVFQNSRTTYTNFLLRRLSWNMPFHAEHHAYPSVPFYRLPDLHKVMHEHLTETEKGYIAFHAQYIKQSVQS